jgi:hypothetical protein
MNVRDVKWLFHSRPMREAAVGRWSELHKQHKEELRMKNACLLIIALLAVSFPMTARGQSAEVAEDCPLCKAGSWGPNVQLMTALTSGQTLKQLFWGDLSVHDAVGTWRYRIEPLPVDETGVMGVPKAKKEAARNALIELNKLIPAPAAEGQPQNPGNWTMKQIYSWAWSELPGDAALKDALLVQFNALKGAGMISLTFVSRAAGTPGVPMEAGLFNAVRKCAKSPAFQHMTIASLFYVPADPDIFDDDDIEMLAATAGVLWDPSGVDLKDVEGNDLPVFKANSKCCDKRAGSPTYRKCIVGVATANCTLCSTYCCLVSTICSF